jgi:ADP-ribosylglycohydrolase
MSIHRRRFLAGVCGLSAAALARTIPAAEGTDANPSRAQAMLIGSLIGDALGGPIEFKSPEQVREIMPAARWWPADRVIDAATKNELADSLQMFSYAELRPQAVAYGPWQTKAARGTITDDSRHKIILIRALRSMLADGSDRLSKQDLAAALLAFQPNPARIPDPELSALVDEGLREYRYASRWILGERDPDVALPVERLWSGIANCSGQMMMTPLAALFPGQPERAYRETFRIDFIDAPIARDIAAAINAGLAAALDPKLDNDSPQKRWSALLAAMRDTDPYRLGGVPFAGRPLHRWLDLAESIAQRAGGQPSKIYELLESEGKPVYYWDAHFTLLVALTMLRACEFEPWSAMHLTLDFAHDTDSYAQILGAMAGAVHGINIFPIAMRTAVEQRLAADYGESIGDWVRTLDTARDVWSIAPDQ